LSVSGCVLTFEFRGFSSTDRGRLGLFEEASGDPLGDHAFNFTPIGVQTFDAEPLLTSKQKNDGVEVGFRVWVNNHQLAGEYIDDPPLSCPDSKPKPKPSPTPTPTLAPPAAPPAATPVTGEPAFTG